MEVTGEAEAQESPAAEMTKANSKRPSARRGEKAGLHLWPQHRHRSTGLIGDSAASLSISPLYLPEQPHVTCANFSVLTAREKIDIENEWYQTDKNTSRYPVWISCVHVKYLKCLKTTYDEIMWLLITCEMFYIYDKNILYISYMTCCFTYDIT